MLDATLDRYLDALEALEMSVDLTIVGNGSSSHKTERLADRLALRRVPSRIVCLHRGSDESTAIRAGLEASRGALVALLPPYLQTDPGKIREMLAALHAGADYVASWRMSRVDSKWGEVNSNLFNRLTRFMTGIPLHDLNSGLRVLRRELAEDVPIYGDLHRFWPLLAAKQGYRVTEVPMPHLEERVTRGDYRVGVYLRRLLDLLTLFFLIKFTRKPLRFFGLIGSGLLAVGGIITGMLCIERLLGMTSLADRPLLMFGVLMIVLGVQLFSLGLLGELIIFTHGRSLRDYHVDKIYGKGHR